MGGFVIRMRKGERRKKKYKYLYICTGLLQPLVNKVCIRGAIYFVVLGAELASYHPLASRILRWLVGFRKIFLPFKRKKKCCEGLSVCERQILIFIFEK